MDERWFEPSGLFSQSFLTSQGWLTVSAEVTATESILYLSEIDYKPLHTKTISIGVSENLSIRREILARALEEGYTTVVFRGIRTSGRNPNRLIHYERSSR